MRNQQIYEEASDWFVRMRDADDSPAARGELMEWLRRSPEHVSAYLDIAAVWMESGNTEVDSNLDLPARLSAARGDSSIAELGPRTGPTRSRSFSRRGWLALAASVLLLIGGSIAAWWQLSSSSSYSTELGEQRSIALHDGSTVELNSDSRVRVHVDDRQRTIELLKGQALFHVAKDASRPFIVRADDTTVRAVGTVFDVYRKHDSAVITVVEGTVAVERANRAGAPQDPLHEVTALLTAGKQVEVTRKVSTAPKPVNVAAATAWTRRELVFEFTPLGEAAAEFNRYNERKLIVEGAELRDFKISAMFRSTDPGSLVRYMRNLPDVRIQENEDSVVIAPASR